MVSERTTPMGETHSAGVALLAEIQRRVRALGGDGLVRVLVTDNQLRQLQVTYPGQVRQPMPGVYRIAQAPRVLVQTTGRAAHIAPQWDLW